MTFTSTTLSASYDDGQAVIHQGHVLDVLSGLSAESVDAVVTSPPYWGQRLYQGEQDIEWPDGWKGGLGLEPTIELYLDHMVEIMRAVRRVMRKEATAWVNIGDAMASKPSGNPTWKNWQTGGIKGASINYVARDTVIEGLKPLDLCLIPQRLAIRLQEDGWWLRSIIIWEKPSAMPESVNGWRWERHQRKIRQRLPDTKGDFHGAPTTMRDRVKGELNAIWQDCPGCPKCLPNDGLVLRKGSWRPTDSFEYILMLTKSAKYYGDREAVAQPLSPLTNGFGIVERGSRNYWKERDGDEHHSMKQYFYGEPNNRNLRSVWRMNTANFKGDHFAVYPEELPTKCILASTSEKGYCSKCGQPWVRVIDRYQTEHDGFTTAKGEDNHNYKRLALVRQYLREHGMEVNPASQTLGWRPSCSCQFYECEEPVRPGLVLDPFCGTGTTLWAAKKLGRHSIGIDISEKYCRISADRIMQLGLA